MSRPTILGGTLAWMTMPFAWPGAGPNLGSANLGFVYGHSDKSPLALPTRAQMFNIVSLTLYQIDAFTASEPPPYAVYTDNLFTVDKDGVDIEQIGSGGGWGGYIHGNKYWVTHTNSIRGGHGPFYIAGFRANIVVSSGTYTQTVPKVMTGLFGLSS